MDFQQSKRHGQKSNEGRMKSKKEKELIGHYIDKAIDASNEIIKLYRDYPVLVVSEERENESSIFFFEL
jgi:hypothetical protein